MFSGLWKWVAGGAAAIAAVLYALLLRAEKAEIKAQRRADVARRNAKTARRQRDERREQEEVKRMVEEQGHVKLDEVRKHARAGDRDHFSRGVRDDAD